MPREGQCDFAHALVSPDVPVPGGIVDPAGRAAPKRFAVYRNNVTVSLIEAMAAAFPAVEALVGEEFFAGMAREFVRAHPPHSPLMMEYGRGFDAFIAGFTPAQKLSFLPDVARVERAWLDAYHAADATVLDATQLTAIKPSRLAEAVFAPHAAMRLVPSAYPLVTIWMAGRTGTQPDWGAQPGPQWALVTRPDLDVRVEALKVAEGRFFESLSLGKSLGVAAEAALEEDAGFDFANTLGRLVSSGAFAGVGIEGEKHV